MTVSAIIMMIIVLVGYFGGFLLLLNRAFKRKALRDGND
jgi:hypothetical protein